MTLETTTPNLNRHKRLTSLVVIHSQREIGFSADSAVLLSVYSSLFAMSNLTPRNAKRARRPVVHIDCPTGRWTDSPEAHAVGWRV
jgi:hypothetical protein